MKRLIFAAFVALIFVALTIWGDRILGRTLDAELGPLLTRQLGLPVKLSPIKAKVFKLQATSSKLTMGDPNDPAVLATQVEVSLAWSDLLRGEIRLVHAKADDLMVKPSRWPTSGNPLPDNYQFLDPWLPKTLQFETGRYASGVDENYPLRQLRWQRKHGGGANINWLEDRAGGKITLTAELKSLVDLLQLSPIELEITIAASGKKDATIELLAGLQPGEASGYTLDTQVQAADMKAHIVATNKTPWALPEKSQTTINQLQPVKLLDLISKYTEPATNSESGTMLDSTLPKLALPNHQGRVTIDEIRIKGEVGKDTVFDFTTGEQGIKISSLSSKGPQGLLQGDAHVVSTAEGWQLNLSADMQARDASGSIATQYLNTDWLWRTGRTRLDGKGDTWGTLLNSLEGEITLYGAYRGAIETPVKIEAMLDSHPGEFALDQIAIELGEGRISGSATLSGTEQRKLTLDLQGERVQLDFLFEEQNDASLPGIAIPEYLAVFPGIDLDWTLNIVGLEAPGISASKTDITLERTNEYGHAVVQVTGTSNGTLDLRLDASMSPDKPNQVTLTSSINQLNIPKLFQQEVELHSRSSGTIAFQSQGKGMVEIFRAMQGKANLTVDFRADNNWQRATTSEEQLKFSGSAGMIINDERILGLQVDNLDIDSFKQDLTGSLSVAASRSPWLIADLESDKLDVSSLLSLLPTPDEHEEQADLLKFTRRLGEARVSLNVKSLLLMEAPLSDMSLELASGQDVFSVEQLDFTTEDSRLKSQGKVTWKKQVATLEASVALTNFDLDQFLIQDPTVAHVPVSGSATLASEGSKFSELLANLTGHITLESKQPTTGSSKQSRRKLVMKAKRLSNGMHADISSLQWGETDLVGTLRYQQTTPPLLEVEVTGGSLSLLPWENALSQPEKVEDSKMAGTAVASAAKASAGFVGDMLLAPTRFFTGPREAEPGDKYFSDKPLPFAQFRNNNAKFKGHIDSVSSNLASIDELTFSGSLLDGQLSLKVSAGEFNKGKGDVELALNTQATPPSLQLTSSFKGVYGSSQKSDYPRSAFVSLTSLGQSQAELAANMNGLIYLELGRGPFDYKKLSLLNAEIASSMFRTLIPGIEKQQPELECGVTAAIINDGIGATPYGFAARTNTANLIGRIEVDLKKEMLELGFDSRSHQGVGISVGSIFSNTIQVKGPLTDPHIVPKTTGILWRSWAAFMTAGLSVVGESIVKRALASDNPCISLKQDIRKDLCTTNQLAASSPMVCPKG